jgi:hypothetical protein
MGFLFHRPYLYFHIVLGLLNAVQCLIKYH